MDRILVYFFESDTTTLGTWLWNHRVLNLSFGRNLFATFIAVEFVYYWAHRYNHRVSLGWASHSIHHTPTRFNLTMGYRLGLTRVISFAWVLFLPLLLLGFHQADVTLIAGIIFLYQFFLHTELVPSLGFLEKIFNTPSNHRVHHGSDPKFYGKNLGGITLVFDHVFGTYRAEPKKIAMNYGLTAIVAKHSLVYEIFNYWALMFRALRNAKHAFQWPGIVFGSPARLIRQSRA